MELVYHYTSPDGLYAILKSGNLRFTDCRFLNDTHEYVHINEPLELAMKQVKDQLKHPEILCGLLEAIAEAEKKHPAKHYVFCTSLSPDSLSMWNYYNRGTSYQGYNIGFHRDQVFPRLIPQAALPYVHIGNIDSKGVRYSREPVLYSVGEQAAKIAEYILKTDAEFLASAFSSTTPDWDEVTFAKIRLVDEIQRKRLFYKHPAFSDECEYRYVISFADDFPRVKMENLTEAELTKEAINITHGFFVRNGIVIPYIELPVRKEAIRAITIAPMLEAAIAEMGLMRFLEINEYPENISIQTSNVPIRV